MKKLLLLPLLLLSQQQPYNPPNYNFVPPMYSVLDVVTPQWQSGWSVDCNTGWNPLAVVLWHIGDDGVSLNEVKTNLYWGNRPDVQSYMAIQRCHSGGVAPQLGYSLTEDVPLAPGYYYIEFSDMPYSWACGYDQYNGFYCDWIVNTIYFRVQ